MKLRILAVLVLASAVAAGAGAEKPLNIVATTSDIADLAKTVAGEHALVSSICTGTEDPHYLTAKPGFIARARAADLWIAIGLELESAWELPVLNGSRNRKIQPGTDGYLDLSKSVELLDVPHGPLSRAMGDVHPGGNPHYWLDPFNGRRMAEAIAERLARLRPEQAGDFYANLAKFQKELDRRMFGAEALKGVQAETLWERHARGEDLTGLGGWAAQLAPLRGRGLVTYHKSWIYFAHRFGLRVIGELEPKPGVPPTAGHLADLVATMTAEQANLILQEPFYSPKAAEQVAGKTGARVVVVANSVGGQPEATDYLALMDLIVARTTGKYEIGLRAGLETPSVGNESKEYTGDINESTDYKATAECDLDGTGLAGVRSHDPGEPHGGCRPAGGKPNGEDHDVFLPDVYRHAERGEGRAGSRSPEPHETADGLSARLPNDHR